MNQNYSVSGKEEIYVIQNRFELLKLYKNVLMCGGEFPNKFWHRDDSYEIFKMFTRYYAYVVRNLNNTQLYDCNRKQFFKDAILEDAVTLLFNGSNYGKAMLYCFDELEVVGFEFIIEGFDYTEEQVIQRFRNLIEDRLHLDPKTALSKVSYKDLATNHCDFMVTYYGYNIETLFHMAYMDLYPCSKRTRYDGIFRCSDDILDTVIYLVSLYINKDINVLERSDLISDENFWVILGRLGNNCSLDKYKKSISYKLKIGTIPSINITNENIKQAKEMIKNKLKQVIVWQT